MPATCYIAAPHKTKQGPLFRGISPRPYTVLMAGSSAVYLLAQRKRNSQPPEKTPGLRLPGSAPPLAQAGK
ncbi:Hypothetical predicted protein [Cloeon dipterum]|uniref:Uncharacterized protein n=1 Tax=Cloeon dipterum TaxID=197152 RepID=A0A8S1CIY0_9INSE|nr:Hypothetical predicted protein [Cloeon dipterum]